jgi:hypothetical protein
MIDHRKLTLFGNAFLLLFQMITDVYLIYRIASETHEMMMVVVWDLVIVNTRNSIFDSDSVFG